MTPLRGLLLSLLLPPSAAAAAVFPPMRSCSGSRPTPGGAAPGPPYPPLPVRRAKGGPQLLPARLTTDEGAKELARRPIGSGAYRFVEWVKDERLVMEANRDWWGWEGRPPSVDRGLWKAIPDDFPRFVALEKGDADIVTSVPPDRIRSVAEGRNTRVVSVPSTRTVEFNINSTQPPLSDKRVRQALHYALDVPAIIRSLFAGLGRPLVRGLADTDL